MPPQSEPRGADSLILKLAAVLASSPPEHAASALAASLEEAVPGLRAFLLAFRSDARRLEFEWAASPPPFPAPSPADGRSAAVAALRGAGPLEIAPGAPAIYSESAYLGRSGLWWWLVPPGGDSAGALLALSHADPDAVRRHLHEIRIAVGLLRPSLALVAARQDLDRRVGARRSELELFYETSRALAHAKTAEDVALVLSENLAGEIGMEALALLLTTPERAELFVETHGDASPSALRQFRRGVLREAAGAASRRPARLVVRVNQFRSPRPFGLPGRAPSPDPIHIHLSVQGRFLGLVSVQPGAAALPEAKLRLLYTIASQAALTLDRVAKVEAAGVLKIQAVLDSMTEGVVLLDRRLNVSVANPAARALLRDIQGRPLGKRLRRLGAIDIASLMESVAGGSAPIPQEIAVAETEKFYQVSAAPVAGLRGAPEGIVLVLSDVTKQRRLLDQLAQSEKLSSLGVMISGFAHELNNPLASITGFAQLLAERNLVADVQKKITAINSEAKRCHRIVENLLRFARKQPSERRPVDLNSVLGSVLQLMGYQLQSDGIIVDVDLDRNMVPLVGDFHALQQVFVNIIHNARQAMKQKGGGGLLTIVTRSTGQTCSAEITDTGPGIPAESLRKIFDPFFSTKPVGEGTGLGLSIAYGTVQEHGGTIHARSRVGSGTTFVIEIPAGAPVAEAQPPAHAEAIEAGPIPSRRILVVEDELSLADMMCEALSAEGHHVESAADGNAAREMLSGARYDLIISDMKMPTMGGRELYDTVLEMDPDLARRIIFSTGDSVSAETQAFFQKIGNPYLTKPFNLSDLYRLVHKTLRGS
ncbi:MAG: response regulator [Acidobacteria bacterium]|nr:response regulator [Acidobacteriota bacterium]